MAIGRHSQNVSSANLTETNELSKRRKSLLDLCSNIKLYELQNTSPVTLLYNIKVASVTSLLNHSLAAAAATQTPSLLPTWHTEGEEALCWVILINTDVYQAAMEATAACHVGLQENGMQLSQSFRLSCLHCG